MIQTDFSLGSFCQRMPAETPLSSLGVLLFVISLPHLLYAYVWTNPTVWLRFWGKRSVDTFATAGVLGKVLQYAGMFVWLWSNQDTGVCFRQPLALWQLAVAAVLIGYGQALNFGTYKALGTAGVYYGCRLGKPIPWVHGWPFDTVAHPQYVGCILSVWGALALMLHAVPLPTAAIIAVFWSGMYCFSAAVEHWL
ncbi:hypothetical protein HYH03_016082 [Edaphochlamys debaryana]|uniref:phosphatidyl-N-methylethanolamine N-methyltransferase n=1 Tax=Edaphochlamys debaryana TaxID=47281 RepID=A0A835XJE9_9CHLO|nr:hypothetical protein HYH03_016082 [Edaphochlamys debaryana]|eukprot:KAG2485193.1 hypothetical protein HYH03_016082 [Edaphochlamys debaryana]